MTRSKHNTVYFVMPDLIRHPVPRTLWIADVETPDLIRGRNDIK
jgi:hypothetical protein